MVEIVVVEQALKLPRCTLAKEPEKALALGHLANFLGLLPILTHKLIANRQRTINDHGDHYSRVPMG
jgi:hypothetical protein